MCKSSYICRLYTSMNEQTNMEQPSTADILAEVERRRTQARRPQNDDRRRLIIAADRAVFWLSKHWLAVLNTLAILYVGFPVLAPVLAYLGIEGPAHVIYTIYRPLCNQLPQRSWFLFGHKLAYDVAELMASIGLDAQANQLSNILAIETLIGPGNEVLGYKVALCQRCTAIYGSILFFGLLFALLRHRVRPLHWVAYVLLGLVPMAIDGGYQWLSYAIDWFFPSLLVAAHETTPLLRTITGALFGLATIWLAYPHVQEAMDEFRENLHERFGWQ